MKITLVDPRAQYRSIKLEIDEAVRRVIESGEFILGSEVEAFEQEAASSLGVNYAVGVASGTEALQLALLACGIGPGDGVITTPFTFIATAEAITQCGAVPIFVDIDPRTYNMDPLKVAELLECRSPHPSSVPGLQSPVPRRAPSAMSHELSSDSYQLSAMSHKLSSDSYQLSAMSHEPVAHPPSRLKALVPVHLYGQPCDMDPILDLAMKHNLKVIEDCAQAFGATYSGPPSPVSSRAPSAMSYEPGRHELVPRPPSSVSGRRKVGSSSDAGCFSFFPSKVLGGYGDGGLVTTNDLQVAERVRMLRNHGCKEKYYHLIPGFNSRLDALQAAILRVKLRHVGEWIAARRQKAQLYTELLGQVDGLVPPYETPYCHHVFNYYTVRVTGHHAESPLSSGRQTRSTITSRYSDESAIDPQPGLHPSEGGEQAALCEGARGYFSLEPCPSPLEPCHSPEVQCHSRESGNPGSVADGQALSRSGEVAAAHGASVPSPRDALRQYLTSQGIATAVYYPLSLHLQEVYRSLGYQPGDFPESERAQGEVLSLPIYPELSEEQIERIVATIKDFCRMQGEVR